MPKINNKFNSHPVLCYRFFIYNKQKMIKPGISSSRTKPKVSPTSLKPGQSNPQKYSSSLLSSVISSNYARYLSHLGMTQDEGQEDQRVIYWDLTAKSLLYLKREQEGLNTNMHDQLLGHILGHHFNIDKMDPTPITNIGKWLIHNGYFLAAYALYKSRIRQSNTLLLYFSSLYTRFDIVIGKKQMQWYINKGQPKDSSSEEISTQQEKRKKGRIRTKVNDKGSSQRMVQSQF